MKKFLILLSSVMLLAACGDNTSVSNSDVPSAPTSEAPVSEPSPISEEPLISETPVSEVPVSESNQVSEAPLVSEVPVSEEPPSISVPVVETPDLAAAIAALGDAFVIHYTNSREDTDSVIYCTGKSIFVKHDSSLTELVDYQNEWWVEITSNPGELSLIVNEDPIWFEYGEYSSYEERASNANSLDASLFEFDAENNVFNYSSDPANIFSTVQMLATLDKKNDFVNLNFENVQIKLSDDNSVVEKISITAKNAYDDTEDVTIELTFSKYTELPFGLSDAEPVEAE